MVISALKTVSCISPWRMKTFTDIFSNKYSFPPTVNTNYILNFNAIHYSKEYVLPKYAKLGRSKYAGYESPNPHVTSQTINFA
jgi:hypothetical protein